MKIEIHWSDRCLSVTATVDSLEDASRVDRWLRSLGSQAPAVEDAPAWVTDNTVEDDSPAPAPAEETRQEPTQKVSRERLQEAILDMVGGVPDARPRIREVLTAFGVGRLNELPDDQLDAFADALRKAGIL